MFDIFGMLFFFMISAQVIPLSSWVFHLKSKYIIAFKCPNLRIGSLSHGFDASLFPHITYVPYSTQKFDLS